MIKKAANTRQERDQENTIWSNMVIEEVMIKKSGETQGKKTSSAHTQRKIKEINVSKSLRRKNVDFSRALGTVVHTSHDLFEFELVFFSMPLMWHGITMHTNYAIFHIQQLNLN